MRELSVSEQRYRAVLAVIAEGDSVTEVAARFGVSRQTVHAWLAKYEAGGLGGLGDGSHRPRSCPHQMSAEVEGDCPGTVSSAASTPHLVGRQQPDAAAEPMDVDRADVLDEHPHRGAGHLDLGSERGRSGAPRRRCVEHDRPRQELVGLHHHAVALAVLLVARALGNPEAVHLTPAHATTPPAPRSRASRPDRARPPRARPLGREGSALGDACGRRQQRRADRL
jgi:transposase-like protein